MIRRVYFDLIGLPPTPEEIERFERDSSPPAYEKLVEQLLALPQYGERWGRHWLDVVRFAQSNGYELDNEKPFAWRYRDYVIQSFNEDKPYDRFILEQLAGDELPDATAASVVATGFQRLGVWDPEPDDQRMAEFEELDDIVSTTASTFLGLTLGCARCHDHKFDPMSQTDYYQFLSFFRGIRPNEAPNYAHESANYAPLAGPEQVRAWRVERDAKVQSLEAKLGAAKEQEKKDLHKLMLLSRTYRLSSSAQNPTALAADPANDLLWRHNLRRLEAEALRDTLLSVSGQLDPQMGGRGFFPHLGGEVLAGASRPGRNWEISGRDQASRRSVYTFIKRTMLAEVTAAVPTAHALKVTIETAGPRLRVWCHDAERPIIDVTDPKPILEPGRVGVRAWGSALSVDRLVWRTGVWRAIADGSLRLQTGAAKARRSDREHGDPPARREAIETPGEQAHLLAARPIRVVV